MKIVKLLLLAAFLFNIGVFGGIHDFFTQDTDKEKSEAEEILFEFVAMKLREAERKIKTKEFYSEKEYQADVVDIFRKMMELKIEPGIPSGLTLLRSFRYNDQAVNGKHSEFAKIIYQHEDIQQFFQSSDPLVGKEDLMHVPSWLWTMYLKNLFLALVFFLLECRASKIGLRNPFSFVLLLVFYPVVIGYIFYKYLRMECRSYLAEIEFRRTKEKLFSFLSEDEIAQIKKFAQSSTSLSSWRKGLVFQHSFLVAFAATLIILVIPKPSQAAKPCDFSEKIVVQVTQHLPRMEIENDKDNKDFPDPGVKDLICKICDFFVVLSVSSFENPPRQFCFQEAFFKIGHVPRPSEYSN